MHSAPTSLDSSPLFPFPTPHLLRKCVTNQGTQSQTVCLQSDKKDGPEVGRERHSGNISKLDLAGENSRYLVAHRLDSINASSESKAGGVCVYVHDCVRFN